MTDLATELGLLLDGARPGSRLPAERDLARRMGVSRARLRHLLRDLEHAGRIVTRPQSGSYVR